MTKHISKDIVRAIEDAIDIVAVIGRYVSLKNKGAGRFIGLSPFKEEKTPSFNVDQNKKLYYCFSTSQGGNIFTFIQQMEQVKFPEAVRILAKEARITIPDRTVSSAHTQQEEASLSRAGALLLRICETFIHFFWNDDAGQIARQYMHSRGIDEALLKQFKVGYVPFDVYWAHGFLSKKGYSNEELALSGLFSRNSPRYCLFSNRVVFPIMRSSGKIVGFGGRLLAGDGPKYINSPETPLFKKKYLLYGSYQGGNSFRTVKKAYLVEGYVDVLAMHQAGVTTSVAPLGTSFSIEQAHTLRRLVDTAVLVYDNDEAGKRVALKSAMLCEQAQFSAIRIVALQENDPADILKTYGIAELSERLLEEIDFFEYYIESVLPHKNASYQEREYILNQMLEYLVTVQSEYRRSLYIARTAELFGVNEMLVYKLLREHSYGQRNTPYGNTDNVCNAYSVVSSKPIEKTGELLVMAALCSELETFEMFRKHIQIKDLEDENARALYIVLEELYRKGNLSLHEVSTHVDAHIVDVVMSIIMNGEIANNAYDHIQSFISNIKYVQYKKRSQAIDRELSKLAGSSHHGNDNEVLSFDLLEEKQFVINEMHKLKHIK